MAVALRPAKRAQLVQRSMPTTRTAKDRAKGVKHTRVSDTSGRIKGDAASAIDVDTKEGSLVACEDRLGL